MEEPNLLATKSKTGIFGIFSKRGTWTFVTFKTGILGGPVRWEVFGVLHYITLHYKSDNNARGKPTWFPSCSLFL